VSLVQSESLKTFFSQIAFSATKKTLAFCASNVLRGYSADCHRLLRMHEARVENSETNLSI
jgi:hypothetical protein